MREQLDAIARTVLVLKKKSPTIEDEDIKPGFNTAVKEVESFFMQCYLKMKRHCDDAGIRLIVGSQAKQLLSRMRDKDK